MSNFYKASPGVNKFFAAATDVERYQTEKYRVVEFSWKGARYRLVSTGDLYQLNYCGIPILIQPFMASKNDYHYATVSVAEQSIGYYVCRRKQYHLKDLIWAAFGNQDLARGYYINNKDGSVMNCKIENLEVKKRGIS